MTTRAGSLETWRVPPQWRWHRRALLALRTHLTQERDARNRALRAPQEKGGADRIDAATDAQERDGLLAEIAVEEAELTEIEAALHRLRDGTYGICVVTGRSIDPARLRALPWTRFSRGAARR